MHHKIRLNSVLPTFVPAGFVDVGHSTVRDANSGKTLVIVDSVQSIANHLEATIVAQPGQVIAGLETLPFLRLTITDPHGRSRITSSLELPHRPPAGLRLVLPLRRPQAFSARTGPAHPGRRHCGSHLLSLPQLAVARGLLQPASGP
jgi:hypothetical protein